MTAIVGTIALVAIVYFAARRASYALRLLDHISNPGNCALCARHIRHDRSNLPT